MEKRSHKFANIPAEMRVYKQWLCWRFEDSQSGRPTKVPYNPTTGYLASVTDPNQWSSYEDAVAAFEDPNGYYSGIGFVLTLDDPYVIIDLDKSSDPANTQRQVDVYNAFDSYSERSPSGDGLHIIIKGNIPHGRRRSSVEVYGNERYMTMTGDTYHNTSIRVDKQHTLEQMFQEMGNGSKGAYNIESTAQVSTDEAVLKAACNAVNGIKFMALLQGKWTDYYTSQSEADISFINIVTFYTQNIDQIIRLFWGSPLGQRDKAKRLDYVNGMIHRAFDQMLPPIDLIQRKNDFAEAAKSGLIDDIDGTAGQQRDQALAQLKGLQDKFPISFPGGLVGDICQHVYNSSKRPSVATALTAALGLMSGITGRSYNISDTGLNQYIILLAKTGVGKEAINIGITSLLSELATGSISGVINASAMNYLGPAEFSSGQALARMLTDPNRRSTVSIVGEFGLSIQKMCHDRAMPGDIQLRKMILDLYMKSGHNNMLGMTQYSSNDKNTEAVKSPSVTIVGETTPSTFFDGINEAMIAQGLIPRMLFINHENIRPPLNKHAGEYKPSLHLIQQLDALMANCNSLQGRGTVENVQYTPEAEEFLDKIEVLTTGLINASEGNVQRELWNRAHLKVLRLAAVIAVGCDMYHPVIDLNMARWAYNVVLHDVDSIAKRYARGEIGGNNEELNQAKIVVKFCVKYLQADYNEVALNTNKTLKNAGIIPLKYLQRNLLSNAAFKNARYGATKALNETLRSMTDAGHLEELGRGQLATEFKYNGKCYTLPEPEKLIKNYLTKEV